MPVAQDNLLSIHDFITKDSPNRALAFIDKIDQKIGALERHPFLGRIPRHAKLRQYGYR
ncbi:MAG: type II toxin-antitoxin system RelE/ParE family toxin, partial [Ignavibacteriales bacterium]|nr:type II toxin-antitoxin system RelE/ParE family toxin [Ignavibacteriales bacterium]